jgi:hypothetical protein
MGNVLLFPGFTGGVESGLPVQPVTHTGCTKLYNPTNHASHVGRLICLKPQKEREIGERHQAKDLLH